MTDHDDQQIRKVLQKYCPQVDSALHRDLWPRVLRKLEDAGKARVPWYDWALVGMSAAMFLAFPRLFLVFAYHL